MTRRYDERRWWEVYLDHLVAGIDVTAVVVALVLLWPFAVLGWMNDRRR